MTNPVLVAHALGKSYRLYARPIDRFLALMGVVDRSKLHSALKEVSFDLQHGQCLGIVGDNGAGKSTLLKILAGTLSPTTGTLTRRGRVTAILELGAGFHPDFTGRENLEFGASYIGITHKELGALIPEIIEFSELADAIDRPVKTYSSGMVVRLAFALVTAVPPKLLIIDEALAVGDQHFQKKCVQRIQSFRENGCTILFCSHSLYHVRQLCDTVLWLDAGVVRGYGETESVLARYELESRLKENSLAYTPPTMAVAVPPKPTTQASAVTAKLLSATLQGYSRSSKDEVKPQIGPHLLIALSAVTANNERPSFGVMLEQHQGVGITSIATHADGVLPRKTADSDGQSTWQINLSFSNLPLHSGEYVLSFYLFDEKGLIIFDEWKNHIVFQWLSPSLTPGLVRLPHTWH